MKYILTIFSTGLLLLFALPSLLAETEHKHTTDTVYWAGGNRSTEVVRCLPDSQVVAKDSDHWEQVQVIVDKPE